VRENSVKMLKKERLSPYEFRIVTKGGETRWIVETVTPIQFQGRRAALGNFMDITRRKRVEEKLRESRELLSNILFASPVGIGLYEEGKLNLANKAMLEMFGFEDEEDYMGQSPSIIYASEEEYERVSQIIYNQLKEGEPAHIDAKFKRKDGSIFDGHLKISFLVSSEPMERNIVTISDITWRKQAEKVLAEEKERLAVTLRSIGDGVICTDTAGIILLTNKVAEELTGWPEKEALGKPLAEVFHIINEKTRRVCENPVERVLETGGVVGLANHTVLISRDGNERVLADSGAPIRGKDGVVVGVVLVFRDITERQKMEKELQKVEKLESIGILAGGIAHDFNNILTAILGNISLAKIYVKPDEAKVIERLTEAEKASLRAKDLTQQLLTFSKGSAPVKKLTSISELIKDSAGFALRGSNVRCEFSIPDDLWPVEVDEGQINQVINTLIINADQAMPEGGVIKVRAENIMAEETRGLALKSGRYIKLSIKDQGIGITMDSLPKVFDPYFSTKHKGSGLGLATAYSIIKNHDGQIIVESELGAGTTFYVYLPASEKEIVTREEVEERLLVGKGKVLLMDDEEIVRKVAGEMLKSIGYEVSFARDGAEAIELYKEARKSSKPFDVVVMDLTVPGGMGGKEAIKRLLEIDPEVKAIVSSGYSNDPIMADFKKYGFSGVVAKPYKVKELSKTLHRVRMGKEV
jgi:PAS domain S-box-containing protein